MAKGTLKHKQSIDVLTVLGPNMQRYVQEAVEQTSCDDDVLVQRLVGKHGGRLCLAMCVVVQRLLWQAWRPALPGDVRSVDLHWRNLHLRDSNVRRGGQREGDIARVSKGN